MKPPAAALTHQEAERAGEALHDHWVRVYGDVPMPRTSLAWADLVQFVLRTAAAIRDGRGSDDDGSADCGAGS